MLDVSIETTAGFQNAARVPLTAKAKVPEASLALLCTLIRNPSLASAEHDAFRVLQRELEDRGGKVKFTEELLVG